MQTSARARRFVMSFCPPCLVVRQSGGAPAVAWKANERRHRVQARNAGGHAGRGLRPYSAVSMQTERTALWAFVATVVAVGINPVAVRFSNRELDPIWGAALRF